MDTNPHSGRSLINEARRLLRDSSYSSENSSLDSRKLPTSYRNDTLNEKNGVHKSKTERRKSRNKVSSTLKRKSKPRNDEEENRKLEHLAHPSSCAEEKNLLRSKIRQLEKTVMQQDKKLYMLNNKLKEKDYEMKRLDEKNVDGLTKDLLLGDMEKMLKEVQKNELILIKQLSEQQRIAKEALNKFYETKSETTEEIQNAKTYYKDHFSKKLNEERKRHQSEIEDLKHQHEEVLKEIQEDQESDKAQLSNKLGMEVIKLNSEVSQKTLENAKLKIEIDDLKGMIEKTKRSTDAEIKGLKGSLMSLSEQSVGMKADHEKLREKSDEILQLKAEIFRLKEELTIKERQQVDQEKRYIERIEIVQNKLVKLQGQVKLLEEYDREVQTLRADISRKEEEIIKTREFYITKLEKKREIDEMQKKEWEDTFNELREEIYYLKADIDCLIDEKRRFMSKEKM